MFDYPFADVSDLVARQEMARVDLVFERRLKRYEAYASSGEGINPASFTDQGPTNQRKETHGIREEGNETETLG
jgi:hypothetical protein